MRRARLRVFAALIIAAGLFVLGQQSSSNGQDPQIHPGKPAGPGNSTEQKDLGNTAAEPANYARDIAPLLTKYCTTCHGGEKPKGEFSLEFKTDKEVDAKLARDRQFFERMAEKINAGEMPPASRARPNAAEKSRLVGWIDRDLLALNCQGPRNPGRVTIRRLNRTEYNNTIRDLLHIKDFKPGDDFPADDVGYGFDNNGDVLTLSPLLLEQYLNAAETALKLAVKDPKAKAKLKEPAKAVKETFYNKQVVAKLMLEGFLPRAYRRPVSSDEVDRLMKFVRLSLSQNGESGETAAFLAMRAALLSPHFLFRVEIDHEPDEKGTLPPLNEYELASRLSYFLWSSMPDQELFELASDQKLRDNLDQVVRRMLADPKSRALTENFAGQWLELRGLKQAKPDPALFPAFKPPLRDAMIEETQLFFESIVKEDRSILDFIDADYTFVNEILAQHYGIPDIKGEEFQRVKLDPERRGGILTQASILTLTSTPTRTSPVKRGKWILENIFNAPPPPPPPNVPELENDGKPLTGSLRQVLEKHRADANCAVCHQRLDPLGLALENYDAIGAWRSRDGGFDIDPSGTLPSGQTFKGPKELRVILKAKEADFRKCLAEKMLTYALGRGVEYYDKCAIEDICSAVARDHNRLSALVLAIVKSEPFQYRAGKGGTK
jgi:Protein of unknown function (DUF1592)/Protein of unknown function (DUF1588)/Protein of unknown function (DUF1587)/Protein of unknown function (DUF1585)/Protein of unknown function (DUF1595)/Planctomycete cytochrome C